MEKQTLGHNVVQAMASSEDTKQDASSKEILKDRLFLACILKAVVEEYQDVPEQDISEKYIEPDSIRSDVPVSRNATNRKIQGIAQEDATVNEGTIRYDVIFQAKAPVQRSKQKYKQGKEGRILIDLRIDMEPQGEYDPGYPITKRAAFYCARMLSAEQGGMAETMDYNKLYKVYSIFICFNTPNYVANTITRFKITKEDFFGAAVDIPEMDYNLMESVIIRLGKEDSIAHNRALDLLYAVFAKGSFEEKLSRLSSLGFQADTSIAKEVERMVALPESYQKIGYEQGFEEALEMVSMIQDQYRRGVPVSELAKRTGLSEERIKKFIE